MKDMESIIGPPGTGKTYALEKKIEEQGNGDFLYLTYNRSMAEIARNRINGNERNIGTFHSMLSRILGLRGGREGDFLTAEDISDFCQKQGISYRHQTGEEGITAGRTDWQRFSQWNDYYENTLKRPAQPINERLNFLEIRKAYIDFKEKTSKMDYTDILKRSLEVRLPHTSLLCIDEAQDLTPLMWKIIDNWEAKRKIIALDDEQSIYSFTGIDDHIALRHIEDPEILSVCKRYGESIKKIAENVIEPVRVIKRKYRAEGISSVNRNSLHDFLKLSGTKAILCRTNFLAREIAEELSVPCVSINKDHYLGTGWTDTVFLLHDIFLRYPNWSKEDWAFLKKNSPKSLWGNEQKSVTISPSLEYYHQLSHPTPTAIISLLHISDKQKNNLQATQGKRIEPIYIDTFHASKGLEFDHVMIAVDRPLTLDFNPEERRIMYVGVTRAKKSLNLHYFGKYKGTFGVERFL